MTNVGDSFLARCRVASRALGSAVVDLIPRRERTALAQSDADRADVAALVRDRGDDPLAYFALRKDRKWFFSPTRRSVLAYTEIGRLAYVSGDPLGDPAEFGQLIEDFRSAAHRRGERVVLMGTRPENLSLYESVGLKSLYVGDHAVVDPRAFSLVGHDARTVRQAVNRVRRAGYTVSMVSPADIDAETRAQMRDLSDEWRRGVPERGFSMTMDALFSYPDTTIALARDTTGRVGGFVQFCPLPAAPGYSLSAMRRRLDAPNGLTEFILAESIEWARDQGAAEVSLNFASLGRYHRRDRGLVHWLLERAERFVPMKRLQTFNERFSPDWRPRYVTLEHYSDVPAAAVACGRLEGLIRTPFTRPAPDLCAA